MNITYEINFLAKQKKKQTVLFSRELNLVKFYSVKCINKIRRKMKTHFEMNENGKQYTKAYGMQLKQCLGWGGLYTVNSYEKMKRRRKI